MLSKKEREELERLRRIEAAARKVLEARRLLSFYAELDGLAPEAAAQDQADEEFRRHLRAQAISAMRALAACFDDQGGTSWR